MFEFLLALPLLVPRIGAADDPQHASPTHDLAVEAEPSDAASYLHLLLLLFPGLGRRSPRETIRPFVRS